MGEEVEARTTGSRMVQHLPAQSTSVGWQQPH